MGMVSRGRGDRANQRHWLPRFLGSLDTSLCYSCGWVGGMDGMTWPADLFSHRRLWILHALTPTVTVI